MKLVIRAEAPLTLRQLIEPLRRVGALSHEKQVEGVVLGKRVKELAQRYRVPCPRTDWEEEVAALMELAECYPIPLLSGDLLVQRLPVPTGLPFSFLELMTGWVMKESSAWGIETFSPHAMLWLREMGAVPLSQLDGHLQRIEYGQDLAVLVLDEEVQQSDIPIVREQKNHAEEHIDEGMLIMQVNLDDSSPEWLAYVMEQCLQAGANDVHFLPVTMKKSRPGTLLQVMCYQSEAEALKTILFTETTTFGIRSFPVACHRLARRFVTVDTQWGEVVVKLGYHRGQRVQVAPEYAVCARLAGAAKIPLKQVYQQAISLAVEKSLVNFL
ncbi:nickel insertion protein [Brevibacillus choshinensis]|uniref:nickel insertion protein n=1 Tax=Brevibacillus choshinensis TaxID=54911 RepID=UPI002E1C6AF7|nr:DUF111 family protein [Brevibacillus choshinensis]